MKTLGEQVEETISDMEAHSNQCGLMHGDSAIQAVSELVLWIHYFETHHESKSAMELLSGARAAVAETIGYISIGLGRAAIGAIRLQVDLLLGFTFFCDHAKEWDKVKQTGDGFMMRSDLLKYHENTFGGFKARLRMIEDASPPSLSNVYRILSAHIHGQSPYTIPKVGEIRELVLNERMMSSIVEIQNQSTLALSNYLCAIYAEQWTALPAQVINRVQNSLPTKQRPLFFS